MYQKGFSVEENLMEIIRDRKVRNFVGDFNLIQVLFCAIL